MRYTLRGIGSVGEATISNRMATLLSPWAIICVGAVSGQPDQHASDTWETASLLDGQLPLETPVDQPSQGIYGLYLDMPETLG